MTYVQDTKNCDCNYCKSKSEIPFLQPPEGCNLNQEEPESFMPRQLLYTFKDESIENNLSLPQFCATFLLMLQIEQHRHFPKQIITLATSDKLNYTDILSASSPFFNDKTKLLYMGGRIGAGGSGRRDKEFLESHANHYKLILPHTSQITRIMLLNAHQRNQCCSPAFTKLILNEAFFVPRATSTAKLAIKSCSTCRLAVSSLKRIEPPIGNVKSFRLTSPIEDKKNKPYSVAYWDYKGPILVNDDRQFKAKTNGNKQTKAQEPEKLKIYILSVTCALTRHVTFEVCENRSYDSTKSAIQRVFYERGASQLMISDQEPSFKAVAKDYTNQESKETIKWLDGWNKSEQKADLEQEYGTEFRFQNPESAELMGLVERLHKTITHSMLSLKQANLRLSQITTIVKGLQCMLNKRPL